MTLKSFPQRALQCMEVSSKLTNSLWLRLCQGTGRLSAEQVTLLYLSLYPSAFLAVYLSSLCLFCVTLSPWVSVFPFSHLQCITLYQYFNQLKVVQSVFGLWTRLVGHTRQPFSRGLSKPQAAWLQTAKGSLTPGSIQSELTITASRPFMCTLWGNHLGPQASQRIHHKWNTWAH